MIEKTQHYRDAQLLRLASRCCCSVCGADDSTVVAAHSNSHRHGKGAGIKAEDCYTAVLCHSCHSWLDQGTGSRAAKEAVFATAMQKTLGIYLMRGLITIDEEAIKWLWSNNKITKA